MNLIDIDNFITCFLIKNIEFYNKINYRFIIYSNINFKNVGGRIYNDIQNDLKILEDLKFSENILLMYKFKTNDIIQKYLKILKTPVKKNIIQSIEIKKKKILKEYLNILKICIPYKIFEKLNISDENNVDININYCENCENTLYFIKDGDVLICKICFSEIIKMAYYNNRSYNLSVNKCNYDRISHFKECLKQYQAKQNTFINPNLYKDLENALKINGLLLPDTDNKFKNITKSHIIYFLKELGYSKHYDDYVLIYSNLTGNLPNNISHLEEELISDFEKISEKYTLLYNNIDRKNFINIQFILYRLLIKHNHTFDPEDFINVKSIDRKMERDNICKTIFESLGWEYNIDY